MRKPFLNRKSFVCHRTTSTQKAASRSKRANERTHARFPEALGLETRSQAARERGRRAGERGNSEARGGRAEGRGGVGRGGEEGESARQKGRARLGAIINDAATLRSPGSSLGFTPLTFVAA